LFEKILLTRILQKIGERGLLREEHNGFRNSHSTSLELSRPVEKIIRNFGENKLTGAVYLDLAKAFDKVWIVGILY
jgi:hypothetical protein